MDDESGLEGIGQAFRDAKVSGPSQELRQELCDMAAKDQAMRKTLAERYQAGERLSQADADWALTVDANNTARMQDIIAHYGWPGKSLVGDDGASAAWLLVQHADRQTAFQNECLKLLTQAVAEGEASAQDLAYLTDRVRLHAGRQQVFGTQLHWEENRLVPEPIEDEVNVDARRAKLGLIPLTDYIAFCARSVGGRPPSAPDQGTPPSA